MEQDTVRASVETNWADEVLPSLAGLVEIPALSPAFDAAWAEHGQLRAAVDHVQAWIAAAGVPGASLEVVELPGRSPLLLVDVPATAGAGDHGTVLLYGHLDKQPPVGGWADGLGPWTPVFRDGKLFGRGVVDDGYSAYAATAALEAVRAAGGEHARAVLLLETGEESGSPDLPAYMEHLAGRLGNVTFVVCLDGGGGDYQRMWLISSLRGLVKFTVTVRVLDSAQHSGLASGIVPSSFRILRQLLGRVEDAATGEIGIPEMNAPIPADRRAAAEALAALDPGGQKRLYPLVAGMRPAAEDDVELILNNTWRPTLSVTGAAGLPEPAQAGNVLRTATSLTLSLRTPPLADAKVAGAAVVQALTTDVPYGATVEIDDFVAENGWNAPAFAPWLSAAMDSVSDRVFGKDYGSLGIGGSIPFMEMLGRRYPDAQIVVTGALGADSNAHVPNEWLNIAFAQQITQAVAHLL
ncbi:MAG TPA: M20/M25/M40 family metallo-hydrolase, partial [Streptosporangiaceae bacterium]|nr:M20/M25/M40 family metallo-hydrolase [Streptosporangiaceae bacterium]